MKTLLANIRRTRWNRGATMAEFALTATVCFTLLFGVMEMSSAVYSYHMVCTAREGVRYAIVHSPSGPNPATADQIQDYAKTYASGLDPRPAYRHRDVSDQSPARDAEGCAGRGKATR